MLKGVGFGGKGCFCVPISCYVWYVFPSLSGGVQGLACILGHSYVFLGGKKEQMLGLIGDNWAFIGRKPVSYRACSGAGRSQKCIALHVWIGYRTFWCYTSVAMI